MREMRRKDRQLSDAETRELLLKGEYGVLSTVDAAGLPYGVPLSYAFQAGHIWFHSALEGRKVDILAENARASFCVVGATHVLPEKFSTEYASVIAQGSVRACAGVEKIEGLMHLVRKYCPELVEKGQKYAEATVNKTGVYCMDIDDLTGKARKN